MVTVKFLQLLRSIIALQELDDVNDSVINILSIAYVNKIWLNTHCQLDMNASGPFCCQILT